MAASLPLIVSRIEGRFLLF
uniref:Uncharacterized protein n=1 Tax=Anguilla anguilla TaxID=7936 RepID=A0A0E9QSY4_ANGAN